MALERILGFESANTGELALAQTEHSIDTTVPSGGGGRSLKCSGAAGFNAQYFNNLDSSPAIGDSIWVTLRYRIDSATAPAAWSYWRVATIFSAASAEMARVMIGQAPTGHPSAGQFTIYWSAGATDYVSSFAAQITSGSWVEFKIYFSPTGGFVELNGTRYSTGTISPYTAGTQIRSLEGLSAVTSDTSRPMWIDDICVWDSDPGAVPFVIARQFSANSSVSNAWTAVGGANKFSNVSETPFSATNAINSATSSAVQLFVPNSFSATETGKGTGVITSGTHLVLGGKISFVAKTSATTSGGGSMSTRWRNSSAVNTDFSYTNLTTADRYYDLNSSNSVNLGVNGGGLFFPSSVSDLNSSEFGVVHGANTRTQTVEDIWAHVAFVAGRSASLSVTETSDTAGATITARHTASLAVTETSDTVAVSVAARHTVSLAVTETSDTVSVTSNIIVPLTVTIGITETSDAAAVTLTARHTASLAVTETSDTVALSIAARHTLSLAVTETSDTVAISGGPIQGVTFAITEPADTVAIAADPIQRVTFGITETSDTAAATITAAHTASLAVTETSDTVAATLTARHTASLAATETSDAVLFYVAVGNFAFVSFAITEPSDTVAATVEPSKLVTFAVTETADTVAATITARHTATLAATESADTVSATLIARHTAALAATETSDAVSASLSAFWVVSIAVTEPADTASASIDAFHTAALDATETADLVAASANVKDLLSLALLEASDTADFYVAKTGWGFLSSENMVWVETNAGSPGWVDLPSSPGAWTPVAPTTSDWLPDGATASTWTPISPT